MSIPLTPLSQVAGVTVPSLGLPPFAQYTAQRGPTPRFNLPHRKSPAYNIKKLRDRNMQVLRLTATGMKQKDVAEIVGVSPITVSNTINSDLGQAYLERLREEIDATAIQVARDMVRLGQKAVDHYRRVLDMEEGKTSDRNYVATQVVSFINRQAVGSTEGSSRREFSQSEIEAIKARVAQRREEAIARGDLIEATVIESKTPENNGDSD